jgi:hypothetical protein
LDGGKIFMKKSMVGLLLLLSSGGIMLVMTQPLPVDDLPVHQQQMADYTGQVFPADNALNMPIDSLPVHSNSDSYINTIGKTTGLHPDFGTSWDNDGTPQPIGIPYNLVGAGQPKVPISFIWWPEESDPGPWPIPQNPFIEGVYDWKVATDGDRHLLIVDTGNLILYESGNVTGNSNGTQWEGGCGAVWDLKSNKLRTEEWTSADAAGLPIFPLLIRYDEVDRAMKTGKEIPHAIRFTVANSQNAYIWPARHFASSSTDKNRAPMGLRFRLKANVALSAYSSRMQVILRTTKKYGLIVADNGSNWFFQGTHDDRWDDEEINTLKGLHGSDFEAVDISSWMSRPGFDPNSGKVPAASGTIASMSPFTRFHNNMVIVQYGSKPFNPSITIFFRNETAGFFSIKVHDVLGREVRTLLERVESAGAHSLTWDGRNSAGQYIRNTTCFIHLQCANGLNSTKKLIIMNR